VKKENAFSLAELLIAVAFTGMLLVVICGVFIYGLNSIEKSRIRSTALNLADRKIEETRNLMGSLDIYYKIKGDKLTEIFSDAETVEYNTDPVDPAAEYEIWPVAPGSSCNIHLTGKVSVKGTADYEVNYVLEDYPSSKELKKITVEVTWKEEKTGPQKVVLKTLMSQYH